MPSGRSWQVLVTTRPRHHCATDGLTRMTDDILHGAEMPTQTLPDAFQVDQTAATVHTEWTPEPAEEEHPQAWAPVRTVLNLPGGQEGDSDESATQQDWAGKGERQRWSRVHHGH